MFHLQNKFLSPPKTKDHGAGRNCDESDQCFMCLGRLVVFFSSINQGGEQLLPSILASKLKLQLIMPCFYGICLVHGKQLRSSCTWVQLDMIF